jgi:hypothetical protein
MGNWKLILDIENPNVSCFQTGKNSLNSGLYNLKFDIKETKNLIKEKKQLLKTLK